MKRLFLLIVYLELLNVGTFGQNNMSDTQMEFDSLVRNTTYGKNNSTGKHYKVRGFSMYCETYGNGEPLLFIHGNGGSINAFVKQIPYFSIKYKVIVADSRAHGKSVDKSDSLSYEMMADDYAALLTAMNIDSVNIVGWSDGGIIGLLIAIRHPAKVRKLVITGANLQPDSSAIYPEDYIYVENTYKTYMKMFHENLPKTPQDSTTFKYLKLLVEQPHIPYTDLHKITAPTLVIGGDHDIILPSHTVNIFEHIPNANLWIMPNAGHSTLARYTNEFNTKVEIFLKTRFRKIGSSERGF